MQENTKYKAYRTMITVGRWVLFAIVAFLILFPVYWIFISSSRNIQKTATYLFLFR